MVTSRQLARTLWELAHENPKNVKKITDNFVSFLQENNLQALAPQIVRHLEREQQNDSSKQSFSITSAYKLSGTMLNKVLKSFDSAEGVEVIKEVDESLIAGITVKHNGMLYDTSMKTQLAKLQAALAG